MGLDKSNGYEDMAAGFIQSRAQTIGASAVRYWANRLPLKATVLDLGCGTGMPVSKVLMEEDRQVYGIDASPTMAQAFQRNFPHSPIACEAAEDSLFFDRQFDGIVAWGLLFLLPVDIQQTVLQKAADALQTGGRLLFTAPAQAVRWKDTMTAHESVSPGARTYNGLLAAGGLELLEEFDDEGGNHYYHAVKSQR